jgi:TolB protein
VADGSNQVRLTDSPAEEIFPSWSPDGRHVVFDSKRDGNMEVYVMAADGSDVRDLTRNAAADSKADWTFTGTVAASPGSPGDAG